MRPESTGASIELVPVRVRLATLSAVLGAGAIALSGLLLSSGDGAVSRLAPTPAESAPEHDANRLDGAAADRPVSLSCARARAIVAEARTRLAVPVAHVDDELFAELASGWLDPHGLWSAASDAPTGALLHERARDLRRELESPSASCVQAAELGRALESWVEVLAPLFDRARAQAPRLSREQAYEVSTATIFEDDPVTLPARSLAHELGTRVGMFERAYPGLGRSLGDAARSRYFPELDALQWQEVALTAAVRAYIAAVDPHGQWVPHEEESSLYADDPTFENEPRLWGDMLRTAIGVRVVDAPAPPLELDDLILAVDGVLAAGLSVEHVEELGRAPLEAAAPVRHVLVLRQTAPSPETVVVSFEEGEGTLLASPLETSSVGYGSGNVLLIRIPDVPEDLGHELAEVVEELDPATRPLGILLDLRGNGGGSTEGACGALGVFLPGAPLFPLLHHGRMVEVLSASAPSRRGRWSGPVAALVDQRTASAAEMIAGALDRYGRGPAIGEQTFGKGCIQEYFDDAAGAGVLRLTTLLFALPDGAALQRVGLEPRFRVDVSARDPRERESDLDGSMPAQGGPDVRAAAWLGGPGWPDHQGRVGPCEDAAVCAALRRMGLSASAVRRDSAVRRRSPGPR